MIIDGDVIVNVRQREKTYNMSISTINILQYSQEK